MKMIGWGHGMRIGNFHEPGWYLQADLLGKIKIYFVQNLWDSYAPERPD